MTYLGPENIGFRKYFFSKKVDLEIFDPPLDTLFSPLGIKKSKNPLDFTGIELPYQLSTLNFSLGLYPLGYLGRPINNTVLKCLIVYKLM